MEKWFIQRENGTIIAIWACCQVGLAEEELPSDNEEVLNFIKKNENR